MSAKRWLRGLCLGERHVGLLALVQVDLSSPDIASRVPVQTSPEARSSLRLAKRSCVLEADISSAIGTAVAAARSSAAITPAVYSPLTVIRAVEVEKPVMGLL